MQIPDIKNRLPITKVLAHYNIKLDRNNHIKCPFHDDGTPSCKVYPGTGTFHCFGCGATGDQIEFIQKMEKCDKHTALKIAAELAGEETNNTDVMGIASAKGAVKETENFAELFERQKEGLPRSPKAQAYLKERGLLNETVTPSVVEVGYNSGINWKKLKQCITFPLKDKGGNITSLYGRRIINSTPGFKENYSAEFGKHYYSENRKGLYPGYPNKNTETLIITEAIIDAATLLQIPDVTPSNVLLSGAEGGAEVLSAYGTNGLTAEHTEAVSQLKNLQEVIFFFDGDAAGKEGVIKNSGKLGTDAKFCVSTVPTPDGEDVNSIFVNYGKEAILQLIEERQPVNNEPFSSFEKPLIEKESTAVQTLVTPLNTDTPNNRAERAHEHLLNTTQANKIIYETQTARYIIKGSLPKTFDRMLVSLDVQCLETGTKYRCRLDLYEEKQTRKEAREASEKLELRSDLVEQDLSNLCDLLEEYRDNLLNNTASDDPKKEKAVSFDWQARCKKILLSKTLMQDLLKTIKQAGVIGEEKNIMMLFCSAFSYKMPETLHVVIQGSSGSGKTTLLSKTASFMPGERVIKFTRVTEGSFYNYDEYFFVGMYVCFEDLDGLKPEALLAVRELISNEILVSSTTWKDENGNLAARPKTVRGPMASVSATTNGDLYEDNESRVFVIAVDESREQTKRIIEHQQKKAANIIDDTKEKEATELLQNLVRMLKPYKVLNPYADKVWLPEHAQKLRRLSKLFLALVKQVTLLHQYQRKKTADGRLIATKEDVKNAIELLFDTIVLKTDELDGSLRQFFEQLKTWVKKQGHTPENFEFMRRDVRQSLHISNTQLHRFMNKLADLEYIQEMGGYNNRGLKYKIVWWDDYQALRSRLKNGLLQQLENLPDEMH